MRAWERRPGGGPDPRCASSEVAFNSSSAGSEGRGAPPPRTAGEPHPSLAPPARACVFARAFWRGGPPPRPQGGGEGLPDRGGSGRPPPPPPKSSSKRCSATSPSGEPSMVALPCAPAAAILGRRWGLWRGGGGGGGGRSSGKRPPCPDRASPAETELPPPPHPQEAGGRYVISLAKKKDRPASPPPRCVAGCLRLCARPGSLFCEGVPRRIWGSGRGEPSRARSELPPPQALLLPQHRLACLFPRNCLLGPRTRGDPPPRQERGDAHFAEGEN